MYFLDNNFVRSSPPLLLPTTNYRAAAAVVLIYCPYSSAIKRDLYGATITFTLDTGPPCISLGDSFTVAQAQPVRIHNRVLYTLSALAVAPLLHHPLPRPIIFITTRYNFFILFRLRDERSRFGESTPARRARSRFNERPEVPKDLYFRRLRSP